MENSKQDELFQLIKTLSKTEKTYFKKYASQHVKGDKNDYVVLFEIMEKQDFYDEKYTISKMEKENFKHFPRLKNYLYENLLKALSSYHSEHSFSAEFTDSLRKVEVLWSKGLYSQCKKLVQKVKKSAIEYDYQNILLEIATWEQILINEIHSVTNLTEEFEKNVAEQLNTLQSYSEKIILNQLGRKLAHKLFISGKVKNQSDRQFYDEIVHHPLLRKNEKDIPVGQLKIQYYGCWILYSVAIADFDAVKNYSNKLFFLYHNHPELIISNLQGYRTFLYNRVLSLFEVKKYSEALETIVLFEEIPEKYKQYCSDEFKSQIIFEYYSLYFFYCIFTGRFDLTKEKVSELKILLKSMEGELYNKRREMVLFFTMGIVYFGLKDFKNAIWCINIIINKKELQTSSLYPAFINFSLIVHYELQNFELIDYLIKSTERLFKKNIDADLFEKIVFSKIKKVITTPQNDKKKTKELFEKTKKDFISYDWKDINKNVFRFDYLSWIESKTEDVDFAAIVKSKV
jgi:hypothetical protein